MAHPSQATPRALAPPDSIPKVGPNEEMAIIAVLDIEEGQAYGLSILNWLSERTGRAQSVGAVYTTLSRLEEKGCLEGWMGEPTAERGGRRKRFYRVTAVGQAVLGEKERERAAAQQAYVGARRALGGAA